MLTHTLLLLISVTFNWQALVAQNDGLMDGPGYNTDEAQVMASCYHLLFNCLQTLFAWFVSPQIVIVLFAPAQSFLEHNNFWVVFYANFWNLLSCRKSMPTLVFEYAFYCLCHY